MQQEIVELGPQPGPQTEFLSTDADIAIYGGAAGGGKSYGLLLEPTRHHDNPLFGGVIFRAEATQIRNQGSLWDESAKIYPLFGATPRESTLEWIFPHLDDPTKTGATMKFSGLVNDAACLNWQGSQIPYIGFDELTHFSEYQFFYMASRNRSDSGVPGYMRATCNPDFNSWVRKFIDWWIGPDGFALPERSGVLRWFIRINEEIHWADSKEELFERFGTGPEVMPLSVTFIPATLQDNKIFMKKDPTYLGKLLALPRVERERLLGGNWNVRASAGNIFKRESFKEFVDSVPPGSIGKIRYWDRAATKPSPDNKDPDWTRGLKMHRMANGKFVVESVVGMRDTPGQVEGLVKSTAQLDGHDTPIGIEQDPGSAGVADVTNMVLKLPGFQVRVRRPTKDKVTRAKAVSSAVENGLIILVRGAWNEEFISECENFSEDLIGHDDQVDVFSGAFNELMGGHSILDVL
jgi:predicted phage terminase large subunit-like protein